MHWELIYRQNVWKELKQEEEELELEKEQQTHEQQQPNAPNKRRFLEFNAEPGLESLKEQCLLRRRLRPMTPAPNRTRMPDQIEKDARDTAAWRNERGRLYSVYMRPWTLVRHYATAFVPLLADLDVVPNLARKRYSSKKANRDVLIRGFDAAWKWYISGHIVSEHQRQIIMQFMSVNCGRSSTRDNDGEHDREDRSRGQESIH